MMIYAKGVAHSTLGNIAEAEKARAAFREAAGRVPESRRVHNNTVVDLLAARNAGVIGVGVLTGALSRDELEPHPHHHILNSVVDVLDLPEASV